MKDKRVEILVNPDVLADFDICAKINHRLRAVHLRELMLAEIKGMSKQYPKEFKSEQG